jgi:hypothetical protein
MTRMRIVSLLAGAALLAPAAAAQAAPAPVQNLNLRRAVQAYGSADFTQTLTFARQALRERLTAPDRARAYELLGFVFGATSQPDSCIAAFREMILLDPDRELGRVSGRINGYFQAALSQVLVVRQPQVEAVRFVAGQGFVPIRYIVTSSARVRTVATGGETTVLIDSSVTSGLVNLRWPAQLPDGSPVPPGDYTVQIEARGAGQSLFAAARRVRIAHGRVDTLPHVTALPGYDSLPATEIPPKNWRPLGLAFLYTGAATGAALALGGDLEVKPDALVLVGAGALLTGFIASLTRPAPQPARANLLYNQLLREQLGRRNAEIARENAARRQAVQITVTPLAASAQ